MQEDNFETPIKKKRNRDPLSENYFDKRLKIVSSPAQQYLHGSKAKPELDASTRRQMRERSIKAANAAWTPIKSPPDTSKVAEPSGEKLPQNYKHRRVAICHLFNAMGSPEESKWEELHVVTIIMENLMIPKGSDESVKKILREVIDMNNRGLSYDGTTHRGSRRLINDCDDSAYLIYDMLKSGLKVTHITPMLNARRMSRNLEPLSVSAVRRFTQDYSKIVDVSKRYKKKTGKDDENTPWAKARLAFSKQLLNMFDNNKLHLDGIVFWDEKHNKGWDESNLDPESDSGPGTDLSESPAPPDSGEVL